MDETSFDALAGGTNPTTPPPPSRAASVRVTAPPGRLLSGVPIQMTVTRDAGVTWTWNAADLTWESRPAVTFTGDVSLTRDGVEVIRGRTVTFPTPGDHVITASSNTTSGRVVVSDPITVHVTAPVPPAFTIAAPAAGTVVSLSEGGG